MTGAMLPEAERKRLEERTEAIVARDMGIYVKDFEKIEALKRKGVGEWRRSSIFLLSFRGTIDKRIQME